MIDLKETTKTKSIDIIADELTYAMGPTSSLTEISPPSSGPQSGEIRDGQKKSSAPVKLPGTPQRWSTNGSRSPHCSKKPGPKGHHPFHVTISSPTMEQLGMEQAYLFSSLTSQGQRCTELMRRLTALQEKIETTDGGSISSDQRRKCRKQACLLRSKIADTGEQEKTILNRLGELHVEMQSQDRWNAVQNERMCYYAVQLPSSHEYFGGAPAGDAGLTKVDSPATPASWYLAGSATPSDMTPVIPKPLDAMSPEFVPAGSFAFSSPSSVWQQRDFIPPPKGDELSHMDEASCAPVHTLGAWQNVGGEKGSIQRHQDGDLLESLLIGCTEEEMICQNDAQESTEDDHDGPPIPNRRLSLPCMKSRWSSVATSGGVSLEDGAKAKSLKP